jgi:hypothetical protein
VKAANERSWPFRLRIIEAIEAAKRELLEKKEEPA